MDISLFLAFLIVSFGVIIIPGPNVLVIVSTSILHGRVRGLQTVAGTSLAMLIQLFTVGVATSWFITMLARGMGFLKWLGTAYLLFLGVKHIKQALRADDKHLEIRDTTTFTRGFVTSLTNPKTLMFFSAYLPQFVSSPQHYALEISVLSATFLFMAILLDSCYAIFADRMKSTVGNQVPGRLRNSVGGILYLGAGAWLATTRRI